MKKIMILTMMTAMSLAQEFRVTHSSPLYDTTQECVMVETVSPSGTAVGGVVGGVTGAAVGGFLGRALFGRGMGSALGSIGGGLVGTGVGAEVGGGGMTEQCTTKRKLVGYYNNYLKNGIQKSKFDKRKLLVVKD